MNHQTTLKLLKMKRIVLSMMLVFLGSLAIKAQKSIVIDINYIMENLDSYKKAQEQLDQLSASWRQEISEKQDQIKGLYNKYQADQVLLNDEMRHQREDEITAQEKGVMELQRSKFGPEGELFQKRKELVQPIQDKVYAAIEEYATSRDYDLVFDTSGSIIYVNPTYDKTEDILKKVQ